MAQPSERNQTQINSELNGIREVITRVWWNLYQGCLERGFNEKQSFALVQTYILGQNAVHGIRPPSEEGPKSDNPAT